jgi:DNA sulfur modification protein DndD
MTGVNRSVIRKLQIVNFGPYLGEQSLDFGGGNQPIILVHAENMAGKTSLLNSIRWLFYGAAKNRAGRTMPRCELLNYEAKDKQEYRVSVEAEIAVCLDGEDMDLKLKRQIQQKSGSPTPTEDRHFEEILDITLDGNVRPSSEFDDWVNSVLPEDISRFFLFDGELLNEYEELVREDESAQSARVKQAIEQILGVPSAKNGKKDLQILQREIQRSYKKEAGSDKEAQEAAEGLEVVAAAIDSHEADRDDLNRQLEETRADLKECEAELRRHADLREDAGRLAEVDNYLTDLSESDSRLRGELRDDLTKLWRDALSPRLEHEVGRLERELEEIGTAINEHAVLSARLADIGKSLKQDSCSTCGQPVPEDAKARLRSDETDVNRLIAGIAEEANVERQSEIQAAIAKLRRVSPVGVLSGVQAREDQIKENAVQGHKAEREKEKLMERLKGQAPETILQYERKQKSLLDATASLDGRIDQVNAKLKDLEAQASQLTRQIEEKNVPELQALTTRKRLVDQTLELFDQAILDLIEELRVEVEKEATAIFLELTTDKGYEALRINENYGLTILGPGGHAISVRSAGAEQIVALSLIGALNRLAAQKGPVVMDTPFGRLDRGHRANILRFVPTLGEQVILLVHGGEVDRETDLDDIASKVDREFEIVHPSPTTSFIEPVSR